MLSEDASPRPAPSRECRTRASGGQTARPSTRDERSRPAVAEHRREACPVTTGARLTASIGERGSEPAGMHRRAECSRIRINARRIESRGEQRLARPSSSPALPRTRGQGSRCRRCERRGGPAVESGAINLFVSRNVVSLRAHGDPCGKGTAVTAPRGKDRRGTLRITSLPPAVRRARSSAQTRGDREATPFEG